jgi:hypothetical protein
MANPFGIALSRVRTEWAAKQGVSETIAAAVYLLSENRRAEEVVGELNPSELERVIDVIGQQPDRFPRGTLAALVMAAVAMAAGTLGGTAAALTSAAITVIMRAAAIMVTTQAVTSAVITVTIPAVTLAVVTAGTLQAVALTAGMLQPVNSARGEGTVSAEAVQPVTRSAIKPHGITGLAAVAGADGVAAGAAGSDRCSGRFF